MPEPFPQGIGKPAHRALEAIGNLPEGGEMRAHFAVFLDFRDGRIHRQRHYDCFEPF